MQGRARPLVAHRPKPLPGTFLLPTPTPLIALSPLKALPFLPHLVPSPAISCLFDSRTGVCAFVCVCVCVCLSVCVCRPLACAHRVQHHHHPSKQRREAGLRARATPRRNLGRTSAVANTAHEPVSCLRFWRRRAWSGREKTRGRCSGGGRG